MALIEYLKGASGTPAKLNDAVIHAARWIGRFHASTRNGSQAADLVSSGNTTPSITLAGHDEPTGCLAAGGLSGPGSLTLR